MEVFVKITIFTQYLCVGMRGNRWSSSAECTWWHPSPCCHRSNPGSRNSSAESSGRWSRAGSAKSCTRPLQQRSSKEELRTAAANEHHVFWKKVASISKWFNLSTPQKPDAEGSRDRFLPCRGGGALQLYTKLLHSYVTAKRPLFSGLIIAVLPMWPAQNNIIGFVLSFH